MFDDEAADNDFTIQFAHGLKRSVPIDKVCWIPSVLYDRIVAELKSPQGKLHSLCGKILAICKIIFFHLFDDFMIRLVFKH